MTKSDVIEALELEEDETEAVDRAIDVVSNEQDKEVEEFEEDDWATVKQLSEKIQSTLNEQDDEDMDDEDEEEPEDDEDEDEEEEAEESVASKLATELDVEQDRIEQALGQMDVDVPHDGDTDDLGLTDDDDDGDADGGHDDLDAMDVTDSVDKFLNGDATLEAVKQEKLSKQG